MIHPAIAERNADIEVKNTVSKPLADLRRRFCSFAGFGVVLGVFHFPEPGASGLCTGRPLHRHGDGPEFRAVWSLGRNPL